MFLWISKGLFFSSFCQKKTKDIFLWYSLWELDRALGSETHKSVRLFLWLGFFFLSGVFRSHLSTLISNNSSVMLLVQWRSFCSDKLRSLYLPVSLSKLSSSLPCDLTSLADLRSVADFSVDSTIYLLLEWSGNVSVLYMLD